MRGVLLLASALLLLALASSVASAFYLPGVAPRDYAKGDAINVKVIKLDSIKTQLPYDYYSLPFCRPPAVEESAENLGEVLSGDRIENSMYKVRHTRRYEEEGETRKPPHAQPTARPQRTPALAHTAQMENRDREHSH